MDLNTKIKLVKNIILISGIYCAVVALLLVLNYVQISKSDPVESKVIESLVEKLRDNPNNEELKEEIREYDLLARKAYFTSRWQLKTGGYLLLLGTIVLSLALIVFYTLKSKIELPDGSSEDDKVARFISQKWIIGAGILFLILTIVLSFTSNNYLDQYEGGGKEPTIAQASDENIEVIEVKTSEPSTEEVQEDTMLADGEVELKPEKETLADKTEPEMVEEPVAQQLTVVSGVSESDIKSNHNGFRGPFGNGVSFAKNVPVSWDGAAGTNLLWKAEIPKHGYSSPVIWGNKVFLTGADEQNREVYCFDLNSGKLLWTGLADNIPGSPAKPPKTTEDTGLAAPSVATDGKKVCAIFATGDIICFNMDGLRVWARNLGVPDNHYGHSSSLIVWQGKVFVQYDTNRGGKVMAFNLSTGEPVWETVRKSKISWASPIIANVGGKYQVILSADPNLAGYDVDTGEELWSVDCLMGEIGPSPAYYNGLVYGANEYAKLVAIDPLTSEVKWENDEYLPEVASLVASNGYLFVATSYGVFVCYNAATGENVWEQEYGAGFYASPIIAEGKVFAMDTEGVTHIFEVAGEVKLVGEPTLGDDGYTTPAFANGKILIRGKSQLYCFGN